MQFIQAASTQLLWVILILSERGAKLFEKVIVAVLSNPSKQPLFTVEKRIEQIAKCTQHISNVKVDSFVGFDRLTMQKMYDAGVLLRGLRVLSDFEKEFANGAILIKP